MRSASISDLLEWLESAGFVVAGAAPNKVLADALRWEVELGRARRVGWGRYCIGRLAKTTAWRIAMRWDLATGAHGVARWTPPPAPARRSPQPSRAQRVALQRIRFEFRRRDRDPIPDQRLRQLVKLACAGPPWPLTL